MARALGSAADLYFIRLAYRLLVSSSHGGEHVSTISPCVSAERHGSCRVVAGGGGGGSSLRVSQNATKINENKPGGSIPRHREN